MHYTHIIYYIYTKTLTRIEWSWIPRTNKWLLRRKTRTRSIRIRNKCYLNFKRACNERQLPLYLRFPGQIVSAILRKRKSLIRRARKA